MKAMWKPAVLGIAVMLALVAARGGAFAQVLPSAEDAAPADQGVLPFLENQAGGPQTGAPSPAQATGAVQPQALLDLTLGNFFSAGWDDNYAVRQRATGTPDFPLLRVQTNELMRIFRNNFYEQTDINSATRKNIADYDGFIDWSFNRRLMIELDWSYQGVDPRVDGGASGGNPGFLTRVKLVDTESSECTFNFKVNAPNEPLAVFDTTLSYGLCGFEDLSYFFNVERVGLYYSVVFDSFAGPAAAGAKRTDVQYDVSIAKTLTGPDAPIFRKLSIFEETFAQTDLDGPTAGRTYVTITPGMRFNFANLLCAKMGTDNAVMMGVDIPISDYQPWAATWRFTYIKSF
jgi:hypothetical protein